MINEIKTEYKNINQKDPDEVNINHLNPLNQKP